jgi:hypothetical protein
MTTKPYNPSDITNTICYNCGLLGHISRDCAAPRKDIGASSTEPQLTRGVVKFDPLIPRIAQGNTTQAHPPSYENRSRLLSTHYLYNSDKCNCFYNACNLWEFKIARKRSNWPESWKLS